MIQQNIRIIDGFEEAEEQHKSFGKTFLRCLGAALIITGIVFVLGTIGYAEHSDIEIWRVIVRCVLGSVEIAAGILTIKLSEGE